MIGTGGLAGIRDMERHLFYVRIPRWHKPPSWSLHRHTSTRPLPSSHHQQQQQQCQRCPSTLLRSASRPPPAAAESGVPLAPQDRGQRVTPTGPALCETARASLRSSRRTTATNLVIATSRSFGITQLASSPAASSAPNADPSTSAWSAPRTWRARLRWASSPASATQEGPVRDPGKTFRREVL